MTAVRHLRASVLGLAALCLLGPGGTSWAASARGGDGSQPVVLAQAQDDAPDDPGAGDAAALLLRVSRLEQQLRQMTGQIEQLQFENRKLEDNLRKMQGDVDFRLQDLEHPSGAARPATPQRRSDADIGTGSAPMAMVAPPASAATASVATTDTARPARRVGGGDAFNPDSDPNAPGAPRPLGSTAPSAPIETRAARQSASNAPLDLMRPGTGAVPADAAPAVIDAPAGAPRDVNSVASLAPGGTRDEFEQDMSLYKQGQYDGAATGFKAFADKYPKDRLVPEAVFLAGESYARLGRQREAAEQFLKVSTDYAKSGRAPDALLRLGMALSALGAKEQACATYSEVGRRYPAASNDVRVGVDRETKRARCPGNG